MSDYIWNLIFINDLNNFEILQQVLIQLPQNKQIHCIKCWFLAKKKKLNAASEVWLKNCKNFLYNVRFQNNYTILI